MIESKNKHIKTKFINSILLKSGNKSTAEKSFVKSLKLVQKSSFKNHKSMFKTALLNLSLAFKLNKQSFKKGKKKSSKIIPYFLTNSLSRTFYSFKLFKNSLKRTKSLQNIPIKLASEIVSTSSYKGNALVLKSEILNQLIANKRYLNQFRW